MSNSTPSSSLDRRDFMKTTAVAGAAVLTASAARGATAGSDGLIHRNERKDIMQYTKLGKTDFMCSKLVFGCGAALMGGKAVRLLDRAYEAGVNHYDIGTDTYYKGSEKFLAPFLKAHGDDVWVTSKAFVRADMMLKEGQEMSVQQAKESAEYWQKLMDDSLRDLGREHVDAYYLMGVNFPATVRNEEMHNQFLKAKAAGKVDHFGISTHKRAGACLEAASETGWYSLAMIAITPAGWYDWDTKSLLEGTPDMKTIRPILDKARNAGIGLVGMKAGRFIAPGTSLGKGDETAFDSHYDEKFSQSGLTAFQKSYAFVLAHGLDVVNADMQSFKHFEDNLVAANKSHELFA